MSRKQASFSGQWGGRLIEMLESPAYRALSLSGHRIISRLEIELGHHAGKDNGKLPVTYDQFQEYGIDRQAIAPAIREVVALGFVEITKEGRAGNAAWRAPNHFRLTYRHTKGSHNDGTHEWRKIETAEQANLLAKAARKPLAKNISQCGFIPVFGRGFPPHKPPIHSGETPTTVHSGETHTTIYISGRGPDLSEPKAPAKVRS